ncbi:hypothetical protein HID58_060476 [Brassica napus]|uniref:Uncharacterized protein n=3 Tax=Brassica TaxID=3705 RepID=A0ABQ7ZWW3_BRANA|nr:hypothetical protein HID58_060476 [Brassica napus]CDY64621.1 BnaCnng44390D [Brassica napus]
MASSQCCYVFLKLFFSLSRCTMNGGSGEDSVTSTFTARWKYYFIWSISEASIIISGLGFSGWTDENTQTKAKWDRAKNVDILGVELAKSAVQIPLVWNIQVSTWLRHYVYERIVKPGKTAGFFPLLATQTVSAMWHGLYPGYIIFFVQSALMIDGSKGMMLLSPFNFHSRFYQYLETCFTFCFSSHFT